MTPAAVVEHLTAACAPFGLDLLAPLRVGDYDGRVDRAHRLPDLRGPDALAVVIGNSRALWKPFVGAFRSESALQAHPDPLEAYVRRAVAQATAGLPVATRVCFADDVGDAAEGRRIAFQALAEVAGLAWRAPSHLSVHPVHGPWIGLRAVVVCDVPTAPVAPALRPCFACEGGCEPALRAALESAPAPRDSRELAGRWRPWLALRDACPLGQGSRYPEAQIRYHYTKDKAALWVD